MTWRRIAAWTGVGLPLAGGLALAVWPEPAVPKQKPVSVQRAPETVMAAPRPAPPPNEAPYVVKRVLDVASPMKFGEWHWDEKGAPATGEIVITVDLEAQVLSVFRDGYEIGTAVALYGADVKPTPLGVFKVSQRDADHVSNLYDAPMPYMLRLTNDGVSIHGSNVQAGFMTHGCVGVPTAFAKKLFAVTKLGTKVIVTRGEMLDVGGAITAA
ncbi:L,D-transpeptidase family protein [Sphingomonas sp. Leaf343]|uniref:L,D-transpeptidase family protein n=1 Tax=Sphingomonas sp. Leaf343 TaxID=1736345 RepID=UPI0006F2151B|nr:L,D-transpeptidase family protein [Sphingomonas sp. Leaf343]KQR87679.1 hypothetical protein ASG07_01970 [Sphingomonas sp. Leaf343]